MCDLIENFWINLVDCVGFKFNIGSCKFKIVKVIIVLVN